MQKVNFLPSDFPEKDSFSCLFLICQLHIIAELVHHLHEGLIHDLLPALGVNLRKNMSTIAPLQLELIFHESIGFHIIFCKADPA